jgi:excisionase family DNA binding protein
MFAQNLRCIEKLKYLLIRFEYLKCEKSMLDILSIEEACKYLKMSKVTLYWHVRSGVIPAFKMGGAWKFHRISLSNWIQESIKDDTKKRSSKNTQLIESERIK